jgi:hypothetical protein
MGKKIAVVIAVVVAAAAGVAVFVVTQLDRMVADAVETYGQAATGTDVTVGGVNVSLTDSRGQIRSLTIGNPEGFTTDNALSIDSIELDVDLGSLTGDVPVITEVIVEGAALNAEQRGETTNLTEIQRYMNETSGEPESAEPADEGRIIIDRFRLTGGRVTLTSELLNEPETLDLDEVVVEGIGRASGGATYAEATEAVLGPILAAARSAVQGRLRDTATDAARDEIEEEARERLQNLLDRN